MIKVLIIDDEVPIREWLNFCVNKFNGFEVIGTASNGEEGYSIFKEHLPDIVFTDIRMPIMDGLEMMKMIQNIKPDIYSIVLTSHVEFEYARKALQLGAHEYVLKTEITEKSVGELLAKGKKKIEENRSDDSEYNYEKALNRNNFLKSLILKDKSITINEDLLKKYDIIFDKGPIFALSIISKPHESIEKNKVILPKVEGINNVIKFNYDLDHIMVMGNINGSHSRKEQQDKCIEYCNEIIKKYPCKIGVSDIFDNISSLDTTMRQAYSRISLSFYSEREKIFAQQTTILKRPTNGEKLKVKLSKELINQNYLEVINIKNQIKQEIEQEKPIDIEYVKEVYIFIITSIMHVTNENIELIEEDFARINSRIIESNSFVEINKVLEEAFQIFNDKYNKDMSNCSYAIRSAIKYMNENYSKSINLSDVAKHVGLSSEYLSRLFKEETGIKFIVYLNNIRLKQAVKMLQTSNLKVYEIAEKVGYANLSYFSTVFKKSFGINPFDYKNKFCKNINM